MAAILQTLQSIMDSRSKIEDKKEEAKRLRLLMLDEQYWSAEALLPDHFSENSPALCVYQNQLLGVHRGSNTELLHYFFISSKKGHTADLPMPGHYSRGGPALAIYNDQLSCVHGGGRGD